MDLFKQTMKGPTRPAPSVPRLGVNRYSPVTDFNDDPFGTDVFEPIPSFTQKKKPPPRPPPPKLKTQPDVPAKPSHFVRKPTVLSALLSRNKNAKNTANQNTNSCVQTSLMDLRLEDTHKMFPKCEVRDVALIDLWSPPGSPTLTTRSSSDGLSVDSFGSDATSHPLASQHSASQPESGFEDDFDLFLHIPKDNTIDDFTSVDPFSPQPLVKPSFNKSPLNKHLLDMCNSSGPAPSSKGPTIIRAKPARPKPPDNSALLKTTFGNNFPITSMNVNTTTPIQKISNGFGDTFDLKPSTWEDERADIDWDDDKFSSADREASPPMPTVPPPPPPDDGDWSSDVVSSWPAADPPAAEPAKDQSYAIALFDYTTGHPDDLCFTKKSCIELLRRIDAEWLYGRLDGAEGLFPANYVDIKVPLPGESSTSVVGTATALFDLQPEQPNDLPFCAGDTIAVLHRVSDQWYYGHCNGHTGHFPANYVQMH